jgi:hypothetical protein
MQDSKGKLTGHVQLSPAEKALVFFIPFPLFHVAYYLALMRRGRFARSNQFWNYAACGYLFYLLLFLLIVFLSNKK